MSSWEEIANEVAPVGVHAGGLATGASRRGGESTRIVTPLQTRIVACPPCEFDSHLDVILKGAHRDCLVGCYYHIVCDAVEYDAMFTDLTPFLGAAPQFLAEKMSVVCCADELLFVDIETTGLSSNSPLFLIGALHNGNGNGALLELFLARTPDEECAAIAAFLELVAGRTLVTFNGKRFDWPYIESRSRRHGLRVPALCAHFDLLHHARSHWRPFVPNCKLQTLEYYLCGRQRSGDVASSHIPAQYRQFARLHGSSGGGAHLMAPIVYHNTWDVLTMADLLRRCDQTRDLHSFAT